MNQNNKIEITRGEKEITFSRLFNAPRELVFEMFKDADHLSKWWGPKSWPVNHCEVDFRVGGTWHYSLKSIETGEEAWAKAIYSEIEEPSRIVFTDSFTDKDGNIITELPTALTTVSFEIVDGKTRLISTAVYQTAEAVQKVVDMGMTEGVTETWETLAELVEKQGESA